MQRVARVKSNSNEATLADTHTRAGAGARTVVRDNCGAVSRDFELIGGEFQNCGEGRGLGHIEHLERQLGVAGQGDFEGYFGSGCSCHGEVEDCRWHVLPRDNLHLRTRADAAQPRAAEQRGGGGAALSLAPRTAGGGGGGGPARVWVRPLRTLR